MPVQSRPLFSAPLTIMSRALSLREAKAARPTVVPKSSFHVLLLLAFFFAGGGGFVSEIVFFFFLADGDGSPDSTMPGACCRRMGDEVPWRPSFIAEGEALPFRPEGTTKAPAEQENTASTASCSCPKNILETNTSLKMFVLITIDLDLHCTYLARIKARP